MGQKSVRGMVSAILAGFILLLMPGRAWGAMAMERTGGVHILMTDAQGTPLPGAQFRVAREASLREQKDPACERETITVEGKEMIVVYETFHSSGNTEGRQADRVRTDGRGRAAMYGLPHGTHYLIESEAPEGYQRIPVPIRVSVNRYSHLTWENGVRDDAGKTIDNTIHIINLTDSVPETGGSGVFYLIIGGIGMGSSAMALWLLSRRRRN